ncbi:MAG: TIR domain-containing protein [Desulfarculus sp.]|nr:TIR domain-containing protein [Desulfarculus sp.]
MKVFISWSGELSRVAAEKFNLWISSAFNTEYAEFIISTTALHPGDRWRIFLDRQLSESDVAIIFLTRESRKAPWVLFEAGAVGKSVGSRIFPILVDISFSEVPNPFEPFQSIELLNGLKMWELALQIRMMVYKEHGFKVPELELKKSFDQWYEGYRKEIQKVIGRSFYDGEWSTVGDGLVVGQIARSPFVARSLFRVATHRLDFIAQNHYYITVDCEEEHLELIRKFLRNKHRSVNILAMDPTNRPAVRAWSELMASPHFSQDLNRAVSSLHRWKQISLKEKWPGTLSIKLTGLIATSQSFYDGDRQHGGLVMVPQVNKPSNFDRPAIVITRKQHRVAFDSYWTSYFERLRRAKDIE